MKTILDIRRGRRTADRPVETLFLFAEATRHTDPHPLRREARRQHDVTFDLLEIAEGKGLGRGARFLQQLRPIQGLQFTAGNAIDGEAHLARGHAATVDVLSQGDGVMPGVACARGKLGVMHAQAMPAATGTDQPLVEIHIGLEARDLLFARLLQYRAFKEIAATFGERILAADKSFPRVVALDPALASLLPEVLIGVGAQRFAAIAERVLTPKVSPVVAVEHLHMPLVSVTEESKRVVEALRHSKSLSFRNLISDADSTLVVVARFLALLDLYRQGVLRFDQVVALGELHIRWTGSLEGEVEITDEFDIPVVLEMEDSTESGENV